VVKRVLPQEPQVDESAAPEMRGQGGQPGISFAPAKKRRISQLEPALTPIAIALCFRMSVKNLSRM
jgi:hypothetical protein